MPQQNGTDAVNCCRCGNAGPAGARANGTMRPLHVEGQGPDVRSDLPSRLRRLLYRAVDFVGDSRHAARQTGRCALRAAGRAQSLPHFRPAGAACSLRQPDAGTGNVRRIARRSDDLSGNTGTNDNSVSRNARYGSRFDARRQIPSGCLHAHVNLWAARRWAHGREASNIGTRTASSPAGFFISTFY